MVHYDTINNLSKSYHQPRRGSVIDIVHVLLSELIFLKKALCRMFLPPEAKIFWTFGLIFYFYTMENDAFGMDLLVLNHKKNPVKFLI